MTTARKPMEFSIDTPNNGALVTVPTHREREERQQIGARINASTYRKLKILAVTSGEPVQALIEQAILEFLERSTT